MYVEEEDDETKNLKNNDIIHEAATEEQEQQAIASNTIKTNQGKRPERKEKRKLFEDIQVTISKSLSFEVKKLDNVNITDAWNKTQFYSALQSLALLQDYLPAELISEIRAYQEFLSGRRDLEQHVQTISKIGDPFAENEEEAHKELKDYTTPTDEELQKLIKSKIMNKRQIIASLNNIANTLDNNGLYPEANTLTNVMKKLAQEDLTPN